MGRTAAPPPSHLLTRGSGACLRRRRVLEDVGRELLDVRLEDALKRREEPPLEERGGSSGVMIARNAHENGE